MKIKVHLITLFIFICFPSLLFSDITVEYMEGDAYRQSENSGKKLLSVGDRLRENSILYIEEHSLVELDCNGIRVTVNEQGYYPAVLFHSNQPFVEKKGILADLSSKISKMFHSDSDITDRYDNVGGVRGSESEIESLIWSDEDDLLQYAEWAIQEQNWKWALACLEDYELSAEIIKSRYYVFMAHIYIQGNNFQGASDILEEADIPEDDEYYELYRELKKVLTE